MCFNRRWRWDDAHESRRDSVWDLFERDTRERPPPVTIGDRERDAEAGDPAKPEREPART